MRRRSHALVLVAGAAGVLLLSAPALGVTWLSPETPVITSAGAQQSPAIAVNPATPSMAAVVADDGNGTPPFPRTATTSTADWTAAMPAWTAPGSLSHSGSSSNPAGEADIAWGSGSTVDAVDMGSASGGGGQTLCTSSAGVFLSQSTDGGTTYGPALQVDSASSTSELFSPAIAVTGSRIYVAYAVLRWGASGCGGTPDSSQISVAYSDNQGISWTIRRASPLATSGHYLSPSLAVLPDGRVIVAFRNDSTPSPEIETETCTLSPSPPATDYCGGPTAGLVGASTVVGDATAPSVVSGIAGPPTPSIVAAGGRVTVAWHAQVGTAVRAFAAMSTDSGATFGPAQQIDPNGSGNQVAPQLAATAAGRVDVAYLWDPSGGGLDEATSASANPPLPGATTEAWSNPVVVQAVAANAGTAGIPGDSAPLGRRLGIATAAVDPSVSPLPATLVALTDTSSGTDDVHVVALLHGSTTPVIGPQTVTASKNATTIVQLDASDADGDPLTWSVGSQPANPGSSVTVADAARGDFKYSAADVEGSDAFQAVVSDGLHQAQATITVNVVNNPPVINCTSLVTREDTPLVIPPACVTDPNGDPVTVTLDTATGGSVEHANGQWLFVPASHSLATGSFVLHATDGEASVEGRITVMVTPPIGKTTLTVTKAGKQRVLMAGAALRLSGHAVDAQGNTLLITWTFGDGTPSARGSSIAHRFLEAGAFTVRATVGGATPVPVKVVVRNPTVQLVGAPSIAGGVMQVHVRTRAAGRLLLRVDSRSQTVTVPAGSKERTMLMQVTSGPLVRLTLQLTPRKRSAQLLALSVHRLVLVGPLLAG